MPDPTLTFDLVHAQFSLTELLALFAQGFDLLRQGFCALPFTKC